MFDIQNMNHKIHKKLFQEKTIRRNSDIRRCVIKYIQNFMKILLRPITLFTKSAYHHYYPLDWSIGKDRKIINEIATDPQVINSYLKRRDDVKYHLYGVVWNAPITLKKIDETGEHKEFDRLVYKLQIV